MFKMLIVLLAVISAYIFVAYRPEMNQAQTFAWVICVLFVVIVSCLSLHKFIAEKAEKLYH